MPKIIFSFRHFLFPILKKAVHFFYMKRNRSLKNKKEIQKKMKQHKLTFNQICARAEKDNSEKLMSKARTANALAKRSRGLQKEKAYAVKSGALASLVRKMPARVDVRKDIILTDFVVVELKNTNVGLHFPVSSL